MQAAFHCLPILKVYLVDNRGKESSSTWSSGALHEAVCEGHGGLLRSEVSSSNSAWIVKD